MSNDKDAKKRPTTDLFDDLEALRVSQSFSAVGVKKLITHVPVRKPGRQEFFRINPDDKHQLSTYLLIDDADREAYLVEPELVEELADLVTPMLLFLYVTRAGDPGLIPCKLPGPDGRPNVWNDSMIIAAERAMTKWVRMAANMQRGLYETYEATGKLDEPVWPELTFNEILRIAFKGRVIDSVEHPVVMRLRGKV